MHHRARDWGLNRPVRARAAFLFAQPPIALPPISLYSVRYPLPQVGLVLFWRLACVSLFAPSTQIHPFFLFLLMTFLTIAFSSNYSFVCFGVSVSFCLFPFILLFTSFSDFILCLIYYIGPLQFSTRWRASCRVLWRHGAKSWTHAAHLLARQKRQQRRRDNGVQCRRCQRQRQTRSRQCVR